MITINPAWQLGVDKRVGSIEVGKDADLAIFSAHPFSPDARVEMTLVEGAVVFDRERDLAARRPRRRREVADDARRVSRSRCLAAAGARRRRRRRSPSRAARVVTVVAAPALERGTVVISGGKIAAVGADVPVPPGATVIDAAGKTRLPRPHRRPDHARASPRSAASPGSVDTTEVGDVNPHAQAWVARAPAQRADPGGARQRRHRRAGRARRRPRVGPERAHPPRRHHAGRARRQDAGRHARRLSRPAGPPFDIARMFDEPELKTFEERQKEKKKNQEKDLRRLAPPARGRQGAPRRRSRPARRAARSTWPSEALAPVARGEVPVVMRADAEEDIRGAVAFAARARAEADRGRRPRGLALRGRC